MDPLMYGRLAEEHRRDLLREAARERLAVQARGDQPTLFTQMRLRASMLLFTLGRLLKSREQPMYRAIRAPQSPN